MTTARDIIAGAYRRLGLLPLGSDLDPDRAAAGLCAYNDMMNAWAADGIFPGGPTPRFGNRRLLFQRRFYQWRHGADAGAYPPYGPSDTSRPPNPNRYLMA